MSSIKLALKLLIVPILCCLVFSTPVFSQLNKGNEAFKSEHYFEAIEYYQKALKKDPSNIQATENIAFCYRKLKDYANAETYYAKAVELNPNESSNNLYYGQALKNNGKITDARAQFEEFNKKNPTSLIGKLMLQSCQDVMD